MTEIKICGLFRDRDIDYVNEAGPDYAGFILNYPPSRRNLSPARAGELQRRLRPEIKAVGVFVNETVEEVCRVSELVGLNVIQLHGQEDAEYIAALRKLWGRPIWKAFRVRSCEDLSRAEASSADEILLDNGYGTGEAFDWSLAAGLHRPFLLAGGLTPENIPQAIRELRPKLLDISSGVETDGVKDREKIRAAVLAAHGKKKEGNP
ncbi:MAG: phosphoribosylanthranilate isomerase [Oscillospiraceae bacterium]|nr:phosphoribosylanthranilate isomerase [Oscillospiraceae bacterium]